MIFPKTWIDVFSKWNKRCEFFIFLLEVTWDDFFWKRRLEHWHSRAPLNWSKLLRKDESVKSKWTFLHPAFHQQQNPLRYVQTLLIWIILKKFRSSCHTVICHCLVYINVSFHWHYCQFLLIMTKQRVFKCKEHLRQNIYKRNTDVNKLFFRFSRNPDLWKKWLDAFNENFS